MPNLPGIPAPCPDPAALGYQGDSGRSYHHDKRRLPEAARDWVFRLRAEKFQPWIQPSDAVFELGVGAGWNLARLHCARRIGSDPATFLADDLQRLGIEFHAQPSAVPSGAAQVALGHHVLEHLLRPADGMAELARIVGPGGRVMIHVPWEYERRYARFDPEEPNHHLHTWNVQNLGNLAQVLGWTIEHLRLRPYGYDRFAARCAVRLRLGEGGFRLLRRLLIAVRPLREVELVARIPPTSQPTPAAPDAGLRA